MAVSPASLQVPPTSRGTPDPTVAQVHALSPVKSCLGTTLVPPLKHMGAALHSSRGKSHRDLLTRQKRRLTLWLWVIA